MNPWIETIGVVLIAFGGIALGRLLSGLRRGYRALGYILPLLLITILAIAEHTNYLNSMPLLFRITAGRLRFVILSVAITVGLTTPLARLSHKCQRYIICILMAVFIACFCVFPFLAPALLRDHLSNLATRVDHDGICYQSEVYTCGPAAAVTALRRLGLPGQEGEIAVLSHTSPVTGTLPWCLYTALQDRYSDNGLECQYRQFDSVGQLKSGDVVLAVIKTALFLDHCVAVLEVSDRMITIADPALGKMLMSHEQFEKIWRYSGIVLKRETAQEI